MSSKPSPNPAEEAKICKLYSSGLKLEDVSRESGFCVATVSKVLKTNSVKKRSRGTRRVKPTDEVDDKALVEFKAKWDRLDSTVKGTICENYAKTRLSEEGFDVWEPSCQNHRTDLVLLSGNGLKRIQVKAGTYDIKTKCFRANFSRHRRGGKRSDYNPEDVDFFIVYCAGLPSVQLYIIPAKNIKNRCPRLFPNRPRILSYRGKETLEQFLNAFSVLL
jgi:hypothetical protein